MKKAILITIVFSGMLFINSCKKETVEPSTGQVKTLTVFWNGTKYHHYDFKYEGNAIKEIYRTDFIDPRQTTIEFSNGKIQKEYYTDKNDNYYFTSYAYSGDSIVKESYVQYYEFIDPRFLSKTKYLVNNDGRVTETYHATYQNNPWNFISKFNWENGNLFEIESYPSSGQEYVFAYTDKGDPLKDIIVPSGGYSIRFPLQGSKMLIAEAKHKGTDNGDVYTYEYNNNGALTVTKISNGTTEYTYYYEYY